MAILSQASATVANSPKLTISIWVQFMGSSSLIPIMEFGNASYGANDANSDGDLKGCIRYRSRHFGSVDGPIGPAIEVYLTGVYDSIDIMANYHGSSDPIDSNNYEEMATHSGWTPFTVLAAGYDNAIDDSLAAKVSPGSWFHIFTSADLSNTETVGSDNWDATWNEGYLLINGENHGTGNWTPSLPLGSDLYGKISSTIDAPGQSQHPAEHHSVVNENWFDIPPWNIDLNGHEIGLPTKAANASTNPGIRYGDVQICVGQCVVPTPDNLAKFISGGKPVNPAIAAAAFGTPTFLFKGNAASFPINRGTGGAFIKTGTVTDFTPGP
jgi:hypothetical protein